MGWPALSFAIQEHQWSSNISMLRGKVKRVSQMCIHRTDVGLPSLLVMAPLETPVTPRCERDRSSWRRKRKRQLQIKIYMKSSSISLTELYVGLAASSSSSTCTFRKESYERAAFSALRASASSWSAFFCKKWETWGKHDASLCRGVGA